MRELIDDGRTGFVVGDGAAAAAAVDLRGCASTGPGGPERAVERFHHDRMVDAYVDGVRGILATAP